jgi:hypothetical protein
MNDWFVCVSICLSVHRVCVCVPTKDRRVTAGVDAMWRPWRSSQLGGKHELCVCLVVAAAPVARVRSRLFHPPRAKVRLDTCGRHRNSTHMMLVAIFSVLCLAWFDNKIVFNNLHVLDTALTHFCSNSRRTRRRRPTTAVAGICKNTSAVLHFRDGNHFLRHS